MAEVTERVTRLEERFDGMTSAIAELKIEVAELRAEVRSGFAEVRAGMSGIRGEMNTQFRWVMGGIGSATLTILVAVLAAILTSG